MKKDSMQAHEELELRKYTNVEFTPYVHDFMRRQGTKCKRCNGLMMRDCGTDAACRCVQCGDVVDPLILRNRATSRSLPGHEYREFKRPHVHDHSAVLRAISSGRY